MAITTRAQLVAALNNRRQIPFNKIANGGSNTSAILRYGSTWVTGGVPVAPAFPGTATICDRTTPGALPVPPPVPGNTWYLCGLGANSYGAAMTVLVLDRLAHMGGIQVTASGAQTVGVTLPARATDPRQVLMFVESYTLGGSSTSAVSVSYTNESGVGGRSGSLVNAAASFNFSSGGLYGPLALQSGDQGVLSVETLTWGTVGTGTGTNWGVTLARLVAVVGLPTAFGQPGRTGWAETGLVDIGTSPCLMLVNSTGGNSVSGYVEICQG